MARLTAHAFERRTEAGASAPASDSVTLVQAQRARDMMAAVLPREARVGRGLARTFQINQLFSSLTPLESVVLALCQRDRRARPGLRAVIGPLLRQARDERRRVVARDVDHRGVDSDRSGRRFAEVAAPGRTRPAYAHLAARARCALSERRRRGSRTRRAGCWSRPCRRTTAKKCW